MRFPRATRFARFDRIAFSEPDLENPSSDFGRDGRVVAFNAARQCHDFRRGGVREVESIDQSFSCSGLGL